MSDDRSTNNAQTKKEAEKHRKAELREQRSKQLDEWRAIATMLEEHLKEKRANNKLSVELSDHSAGFYEEVNKLAKGKIAQSATPLVRKNANDIIADTKKLVAEKEDVHLDRIKEFVPAGDEPLYPDILVVITTIRRSLKRHHEKQTARIESLQGKLRMAATVVGALQYFLNDEEADDEAREAPNKGVIQPYVTGAISQACLTSYDDSYTEYYFDFEKLDSMPPHEYLSALSSRDHDDVAEDADEAFTSDDEEQGEEDGH